MKNNPWLDFDMNSSFVHPTDKDQVAAFNIKAKPEVKYELSLRPEPYIGNLDAKVLLLALNPGVSDDDFRVHETSSYIELHKANLKQGIDRYPFYYLNPQLDCPGSDWWAAKVKWLVEACGLERVANSICCLQFVPYHSKSYKHSKTPLPTQVFIRSVIIEHISKGRPIVIMRSRRHWESLIPELAGYANVMTLKNPRNPTFSPKNVAEGKFGDLVETIK